MILKSIKNSSPCALVHGENGIDFEFSARRDATTIYLGILALIVEHTS